MNPELPAGLADPLHLLEPWSPPWQLIVGSLLCLAIYLQWRRVRRGPQPTPRADPTPAPVEGEEGLVTRIEELQRKFEVVGDPRQGCHELADLLRRGLAGLLTLTATEIERNSGDSGISAVFRRLETLQFGREAPRGRDFDILCEQARTAVLNRGSSH